jgi:RimJ/RimL family protein N-acetyltransferase
MVDFKEDTSSKGSSMTEIITGPAYRIHTARTIIRCWQPDDAPLVQAAIAESVDHLRSWMPWAHKEPEDLSTKIARLRQFRGMFDLGQDFIYGIFTPDETQVIGGTGLHTRVGPDAREIGYWIRTSFLNQGLATEVSAALTKVAFQIDGVRRVEIHCDPKNSRSAAVPRKLKFIHDGTLRQRVPFLDQPLRDRMIWSLLAEEYPASPAALAELTAFDVIGRVIPLRTT